MPYIINIPHSRGFKCENLQPLETSKRSIDINDLFLHAFFARLADSSSKTHEFETKFCKEINQIELDSSDELLDVLTDVDVGPKLRRFLNWLVGNDKDANIVVDSDNSVSAAVSSVQTLKEINISPSYLENTNQGIKISAWGVMANNANEKNITLNINGTTITSNNVSFNPIGVSWELEAIILRNSNELKAKGGGLVGAVSQSVLSTSMAYATDDSVTIKVTGQHDVASSGNITCNGILIETV